MDGDRRPRESRGEPSADDGDAGQKLDIAALLAARAAHQMRSRDRRDAWLERASKRGDPLHVARLVTQAELDEARNEIITAALESRETSDGRADDLARSIILFKNPRASDEQLAKLQTVSAADIQRVAQAIMQDSKSVTIRYLPEETQKGAAETAFADAPTIQTSAINIAAADIPVYSLSPEASRLMPPEAGPAVAAKVPAAVEKTLANGLRVIVKPDRRAPVAVSMVWYRIGSVDEQGGITGVAHVLEHMMFKGTKAVPAGEFSRLIAAAGGRENAFTSRDYTGYFQTLHKSALPLSFRLEAGDRLVIPSDGVTECPGASGDLGEAGMIGLLRGMAGLSGPALHAALLAALTDYAGSEDLPDDVSAVIVDYRGGVMPSTPASMALSPALPSR